MAPTRWLAVPALVLVTLTGCGSETDEGDARATAPAETPTSESAAEPSSDLPACDEVWVDGATLPARYAGCVDADGVEVAAESRECSIGKPLVTYGDAFYAVPGRVVNEVAGSLDEDPAYQSALASCTG